MKIKMFLTLAILIVSLQFVIVYYYSKDEICESQKIAEVIDIGDLCSQYQIRDEQND